MNNTSFHYESMYFNRSVANTLDMAFEDPLSRSDVEQSVRHWVCIVDASRIHVNSGTRRVFLEALHAEEVVLAMACESQTLRRQGSLSSCALNTTGCNLNTTVCQGNALKALFFTTHHHNSSRLVLFDCSRTASGTAQMHGPVSLNAYN